MVALRQRAHETGQPFKAVVNTAVRRGLRAAIGQEPAMPEPPVFHLELQPGLDLTKALALSDALADAVIRDELSQAT